MFRILSTGEVYNPYTRATGYFDIGRDETDKTSRLVVRGEQISWGGTSMPHVLRLHDNRDYNYNSFGNCPGISFAGKYNSGGGWLDWGAIACRKESLTDSEMRSCFSIWLNRDLTVTEKFRISSLGYVGINTTSPGYYLHVNGTACASPPVGTMGLLVYANGGTCSMAITPIGGTPSEIRLHTGGTGQWFNISDGDGTGYTVMIRGGKLGVNMGQYGAPLEKMHTNGGLLLENDSISTSNLVTGYKTALSSDTSGFMVRSTQEHTKFILGSQWSYPSLTMYSFRSNPPPNYYNSRRFQFLFDSDSTTMYPWVIFSGKHQGASERDYMFMGQNDQTQEFYTRFPDNVVIEGTLTVNGEHDAFWTDGGTYIYPTDGEAIHLYGNGSYYQLGLFDTTASNSGVGGCLGFFGKDSNEDYQELSRIRASKSASADSARLDFYVNTGTSLALACYMGVDRGLHMVTDGTYIGWGTFTTDGAWQGIKADSGDMCYDIYTTGTAGIPSGMHSFRVANDGVVTPVLALGGDGSNYFSHFSGLMGVAGQVTFDTNTAFQILNNSNTRAKAIAWDTYSDARIKDNIVASPKGLAELLLVSPKKYRQYSSKPVWEEENERWIHEVDGNSYVEKYGFIAQDLMTVIPEVVPTLVNADKELYGIDYNQLIPIIVKAIQELNAKIPA
jgi:hypothetical protein